MLLTLVFLSKRRNSAESIRNITSCLPAWHIIIYNGSPFLVLDWDNPQQCFHLTWINIYIASKSLILFCFNSVPNQGQKIGFKLQSLLCLLEIFMVDVFCHSDLSFKMVPSKWNRCWGLFGVKTVWFMSTVQQNLVLFHVKYNMWLPVPMVIYIADSKM